MQKSISEKRTEQSSG